MSKHTDAEFFAKSMRYHRLMELARAKTTNQIIWGGNYFKLPPSSC